MTTNHYPLEDYLIEKARIEDDNRYPQSLKVWALEQAKRIYIEINGTEPEADELVVRKVSE